MYQSASALTQKLASHMPLPCPQDNAKRLVEYQITRASRLLVTRGQASGTVTEQQAAQARKLEVISSLRCWLLSS